MKLRQWLFILFMVLGLTACSNQWREGEPSRDEQGVYELLVEVQGYAGSSQNIEAFNFLAEDDYTAIYYAEAPSSMGPVVSVLSMGDLGFLNLNVPSNIEDFNIFDINEATIFFLDGFNAQNQREFSLLVDVVPFYSNQHETKIFKSNGSFQIVEDEMIIQMDGNGDGLSDIVLRSFDLVDGSEDFAGTIQLKVSVYDENNEEIPVGQFSSLVGFGN